VKLIYVLVAVAALTGCVDQGSGQAPRRALSYDEIYSFETDCARRDENLNILYNTQDLKNFASDPDELNDFDRQFNSRLKATIWWYLRSCKQ